MKKALNELKEKWNCRTRKEQILILWIIIGIFFLLDGLNCNMLAMKYNCQVEEISQVIGFYWLSPVFGIVDFVLALLIFKKTKVDIEITLNQVFYNGFNFSESSFTIPTVTKGAETLLSKGLSFTLMAASVISLIPDVFLLLG